MTFKENQISGNGICSSAAGKDSTAAFVFELKLTELAEDRSKYPVRTSCTTIGFFSTLERAEAFICKIVIDRVHHFTITTRALDTGESQYDCERRVYDRHGRFYGLCLPSDRPFAGVSKEKCRFNEGAVIEVIQNGLLRPGIISLLPVSPEMAARIKILDQSDNSYCVEFAGSGRSHDHPPECDIFTPMFKLSAVTRARLMKIYRSLKTSWV